VLRLNDPEMMALGSLPGSFRYLANYVPHDVDGTPWTFEDIAANHKIHDGEKAKGLLSVIKADVDHLSQVFQEGLRRDSPPSCDTPARLAAMSRHLDLFFSAWIEWLLRERFPGVYAVYSGGDDLLVVAPQSRALGFARELQAGFARFAQNSEVTLSAGIVTVQSRLPLAHTALYANAALERAKAAGRNRLCLLDTVVSWADLDIIDDGIQLLERSDPPSAFLHHLVEVSALWQRWRRDQVVDGLRAFPLLAYTISRTLDRATDLYKWASRLVALSVSSPNSREAKTMDCLGVIARWVLLGKKGGRNDD